MERFRPLRVCHIHATLESHRVPLALSLYLPKAGSARGIAREAAARGLDCLDAPVSGGDLGAREARLTIMAGGEPDAFERAAPLFAILGRTVNHMGPAGAGQHTKMANQICIAGTMLGLAERLYTLLAERPGGGELGTQALWMLYSGEAPSVW